MNRVEKKGPHTLVLNIHDNEIIQFRLSMTVETWESVDLCGLGRFLYVQGKTGLIIPAFQRFSRKAIPFNTNMSWCELIIDGAHLRDEIGYGKLTYIDEFDFGTGPHYFVCQENLMVLLHANYLKQTLPAAPRRRIKLR